MRLNYNVKGYTLHQMYTCVFDKTIKMQKS